MNTEELAKLLGISRGTVSRVLNNHPNVKEETRRRVLQALEQYDYTPNETARSLVMKKDYRIAVAVYSEPEFFWKQVEYGVSAAAWELKVRGVTVDFLQTDIEKPQEQLELLKSLRERGYHGLAVAPNVPEVIAGEVERMGEDGFPVAVINAPLPGVRQLCYIGCDFLRSGRLAGELFLKMMGGQGRLAALTLKEPVDAIERRMEGLQQALSNQDAVKLTRILKFDRRPENVYGEVMELQNGPAPADGIFVSIGALEQTARAVRDSCTGRVPCVIGYDLNEEISGYMEQGLIAASIGHEPFQQGYYAVKVLYQYLNSGTAPAKPALYTKSEAIFAANAGCYLQKPLDMEL